MNQTIEHIVMQKYAYIKSSRVRAMEDVEHLYEQLGTAIKGLKAVDDVLDAFYAELMPKIPGQGTMLPGYSQCQKR